MTRGLDYPNIEDFALNHRLPDGIREDVRSEMVRHAAACRALDARIALWQHACPHANIEPLSEYTQAERCQDCGFVSRHIDTPSRRRARLDTERARLMRVMDETQAQLRDLEGDP